MKDLYHSNIACVVFAESLSQRGNPLRRWKGRKVQTGSVCVLSSKNSRHDREQRSRKFASAPPMTNAPKLYVFTMGPIQPMIIIWPYRTASRGV